MESASNSGESMTHSENLNPNVLKPSKSPIKSSNFNKTPLISNSLQNRICQRKFVVAKKNPQKKNDAVSCKCKHNGSVKCVCVAYQNLRASQKEFFVKEKTFDEKEEEKAQNAVHEETEETKTEENEKEEQKEDEGSGIEEASSTAKRRRDRDRLLEEARNSVPETGRVMHLVNAFEKLLLIPKEKKKDLQKEEEEEDKENENKNKVMKWALPGLQLEQPPKAPETVDASSVSRSVSDPSSFCYASELVLTSENLGLDNRNFVSSSWDSSIGSVPSRTSSRGRRSRRNSLESCGTYGERKWRKKKQLRVTSQKPFKLRTEQRGKLKEEEFMKKVQEMMIEEEKLRIPIAQGLPWTTDQPECLAKPQVKESTRPIDLKLHSDLRAIDRAEFDHQVAEKMSLMEQYKLERERQQKLEEEEEIRRLRKELIPKAQPMPYFDRPFVPKR